MSLAPGETIIDVASASATACAKINLTLEIIGKRPDRFHELRSLVIGVDLRDELRCTVGGEAGLTLACSRPELAGRDNLAIRAARELADHLGIDPALRIDLRKRIPVGGGLGGGSSDAAASLRLCSHLWGRKVDDVVLARLGARIGSDVPLFFSLPCAFMSGRGDQAQPAAMRWSGFVLLVFGGPPTSTAEVYRLWQPSDSVGGRAKIEDIQRADSAAELTELIFNDLEPAVLRVSPEIAGIRERLERLGAGAMAISGAGSTLYRLFDDKNEACHVAAMIDERKMDVVTTVVAAPVGPEPITKEE